MIVTRLATEQDLLHIMKIEQDSISPPWTLDMMQEELVRDDSFFALAVCDGEAAGFCILRRMADEGELLKIAVDSVYRRRGVADSLVKSAFNYAEENALKAIFLEVRKSNAAAIALYIKHGFEQVGLRKDYYAEPIEDASILAYYRNRGKSL